MRKVITLITLCVYSYFGFAQELKLIKSNISLPSISNGAAANGNIIFTVLDGAHGREPWVSDGTTAGTKLLKDVNKGANSCVFSFSCHYFDDKLYFPATEVSTAQQGKELWVSDGTGAGTKLLKDIYTGRESGISDVARFINYNGKMYFYAKDSAHGNELWVTDGSSAGTHMVKDIRPGTGNSANSALFTTALGKLFFAATDSVHGYEWWVSDGTEAGTKLLKDIYPGTSNGIYTATAPYIVEVNGVAYFTAIENDSIGKELYATNGDSVWLVKDIDNSLANKKHSEPRYLTKIGDKILFTAEQYGRGRELWITDGTAAGTHMLKDIYTGPTGSEPVAYGTIGNRLVFSANSIRYGRELWVSDGTAAGTYMITDLEPGQKNGVVYIRSLTNNYSGFSFINNVVYDKLYFAGIKNDTMRLYETDGSAAGTKEIPCYDRPYNIITDIDYISVVNGTVWVSVSEKNTGDHELFSYTPQFPNSVSTVQQKEYGVLYPNPSTGSFVIDLSDKNQSVGYLKVIDVMGRVVHSQVVSEGATKVSVTLTEVPKGVYKVMIEYDGMVANYSLMLK